MGFRDFISENRDQIKAAYLKATYDKDKIEKLMDKGNVYIQYTDTRSKSKLGSGNIVKITNDSVIIDKNKFGEKDVEVKFNLIQFATNMKKVNEESEEELDEATNVDFDDAIVIVKKYFPYITKLENKELGGKMSSSTYEPDVTYKFVDGFVVNHNGKTLSKKDFEKMVKADAEKESDRWRSK